MWLLEALLVLGSVVAVAQPAPEVVLTFDNGGFNAPLYASRWTGFAKPSVAREIATSVARVAGTNPQLYTYLPPGRVEGRPGEPYRIEPRAADCDGASSGPADPCWCGPGDRCWTELDVNRHPAGSTSLYLTAAALRDPSVAGEGPRIEIHFTDLFEEDPSTAENPADSDRCVTRAGVRKAVEGLVVGNVDHLAVGLLRARIDPPPPGDSAGSVFTFQEGEGGCWSGKREGPWTAGAEPLDWAMGVVVVGLDTEEVHTDVLRFLDGLEVQLQSDHMALSLVQLREPPSTGAVERSMDAGALVDWSSQPSHPLPRIPCTKVEADASLSMDGQAIAARASGDCGGVVRLDVPTKALQSAWLRAHGVDPFAGDGVLEGMVVLRGSGDAVLEAIRGLGEVNDAVEGRPLPFFDVVTDLARSGPGGMTSFTRELHLQVVITGLRGPAWVWSILVGLLFALATAMAVHQLLLRTAARRAYQAAWDRAVDADADPLRQRPVAAVLAEAQDDVRTSWLPRWVAAGVVAVITGLAMMAIFLRLSLVLLV